MYPSVVMTELNFLVTNYCVTEILSLNIIKMFYQYKNRCHCEINQGVQNIEDLEINIK
jgi:hypothetical protein